MMTMTRGVSIAFAGLLILTFGSGMGGWFAKQRSAVKSVLVASASAQEGLPKADSDKAAEAPKVRSGGLPKAAPAEDFLTLARAAKGAKEKAEGLQAAADEAVKVVDKIKGELAEAEKLATTALASADEARKDASSLEERARRAIASAIDALKEAEAAMGGPAKAVKK